MAGAAAPDERQEPPPQITRGALIRLEGFIGLGNEQYLERKLAAARQYGANLVIVEIDSPGGRLDSSFNIARRLRDAHWAHTVAYIPDQAYSGATVVALGCDEILMGPHAMLGDVGVIFEGDDSLFHYVPEKALSPIAQLMRDLAVSKGRPPALAEAMVDKKLTVYRVRNETTGKLAYMSQGEIGCRSGHVEKTGRRSCKPAAAAS